MCLKCCQSVLKISSKRYTLMTVWKLENYIYFIVAMWPAVFDPWCRRY